MSGSEAEVNLETGGVVVINETDVDTSDVMNELRRQHPEIAALQKWQSAASSRRGRGMFQRDQYVSPNSIFDKMRVSQQAVEQDDIVSGVVETTEQLAFKRIGLEADSIDDESIWQQIAEDLNLAHFMRKVWRELYVYSQVYIAVKFGRKDYKVRGQTPGGNKKKKTVTNLSVPTGLTILDPLRVIPASSPIFGDDKLLYIANPSEISLFDAGEDPVVEELILERYEPSPAEMAEFTAIAGESLRNRLYVLNPERVWRITATRPDYQKFASVRMESVFELLDLKHQLREMDRQALIGTTNGIILVKKGSDSLPAKKGEVEALASQVKTTARMPIIVGDHRIEIEIITPKTDKALSPERYNGLDSRLTARLYQILSTGNYSAGTATDDSIKLLRVIASSMEARRDLIRDSLMEHVFYPVWEKNDQLADKPEMQFYPRRIALDFDPNIARFMQELRDRGDISRETILAELDIIESTEAIKRQREALFFDEIFTPTNVPYSGGGANPFDPQRDPRVAGPKNGGKGGRPAGTVPNMDDPENE